MNKKKKVQLWNRKKKRPVPNTPGDEGETKPEYPGVKPISQMQREPSDDSEPYHMIKCIILDVFISVVHIHTCECEYNKCRAVTV